MPKQPANLREFVEAAAERNRNRTFLQHPGGSVSYSDLDANSNRFANCLLDGGVRSGERVAVMLQNRPEYLYCWFGLAKIGAVMVPINTALRAEDAARIVTHSRSSALVTSSAFRGTVSQLEPLLPGVRIDYVDAGEGDLSFPRLFRAAPTDLRETTVHPTDPVCMIYTSGTTGTPKGVVQTHGAYVLTGQAFPHWLGLTSSDRLYTCLPLAHINAQAYSTLGAMGADACLVLGEHFSASRFVKELRDSRATEFNAVGSMMMMVHKQPRDASDADHGVRVAYSGPALPEKTVRDIEARFGIRIIVGYGMSECTFGTIEPLLPPRKFESIGLPRQHPVLGQINEVKVLGDGGEERGPREVGEIVMKNPAIMKEYFMDPEATAAAIRDGWLFTGDLGYRDEDGFFYFFGRKKDVIRRRGENISAVEIEEVLAQHPGVLECAAIAVPSELADDEVKVYVVPRKSTSVTHRELVAWCEGRLAKFKVPRFVELRESLPKTSTERVAKHVLKKEKKDLRSGSYDRETGRIVE